MKKIVIAVLAVLLLSGPAFAETKLAYVNLQKVLNESKAGAQAKSDIAAQAKEYETEFKIKEGEYLKQRSELEKQVALLSESAKQEKYKEILQSENELKKLQSDFRRKLQEEDQKRTQSILGELSTILQKFGKDGGYTMIFERSEAGLIYVDEGLVDLTEKLLKAYDASKK